MLNRRFLRIKLFQSAFEYYQKKEANYFLAKDLIDEAFEPDVTAAEAPDHEYLKQAKKISRDLFETGFETGEFKGGPDKDVNKAVENAINLYNSKNGEELVHIEQQLHKDIQRITEHLYNILKFLVSIQSYVQLQQDRAKQKRLPGATNSSHYNILQNRIINGLKDNDDYVSNAAKFGENWEDEESILRTLYREKISQDSDYERYQSYSEPTLDDDRKVLMSLLNLLFKNELFLNHFEEQDLRWEENAEIVRVLLVKTLKKSSENGAKVFQPSENEEEDGEFMKKLFRPVCNPIPEIVEAVNAKIQNWDEERVAVSDRILIYLGLIEMIEFKNIPLKVSLNEYIELAKNYSTPKSKVFVNGVLDVVSKDFVNKGIIKKTGRGLIDSK